MSKPSGERDEAEAGRRSARMRLRFSPSSPYARKVRIVAAEKGLAGEIELVRTDTWNLPEALLLENPLGKIPALTTADGEVLFDSPVVCEYLDALGGGAPLIAASGDARWRALRLQALGDGMMDAAVERYVEAHRPPAQRSADWDERQRIAIIRCLDRLECSGEMEGPLDLGKIAVVCALDYLDLRFASEPWRKLRPNLGLLSDMLRERPSFIGSLPD